MIYGHNFGGKAIPEPVKRMFNAKRRIARRRIEVEGENGRTFQFFMLTGVCNTFSELRMMRDQADNGHREFRYVANFTADGTQWYGIYVS